MRNTDFSPLYRTAIGFDRMANMLDSLSRTEQVQGGYPPYNIELLEENEYRITMALAGFTEQDLNIQTEQNTLTISGNKNEDTNGRQFLHQGIAARNFERRFQLADHVRVDSARLENGLLHVDLVREIPEAMKPRNIQIQSQSIQKDSPKTIEGERQNVA
ncbi:Hsp20 family protein [Pseudomaricurvus alkylphenolicus]|jgi:molecular chaperone IbpA|uniref:Hsp20 family protein n=1 Tax=Pseudomaricurvus alkylphenolicus TaxID=1306991 RepID=UPI0014236F06|nr:Hsp20 family protein [Pseudomaricurvus alkylphenolicus]NIB43854.1 Hsp20 family protein [Pseudomaricurvus alkylphenolicus]